MVARYAANGPEWAFLNIHSYVLRSISRVHEECLREVAHQVGITERAVQRVEADLEEGGYL